MNRQALALVCVLGLAAGCEDGFRIDPQIQSVTRR
jgi:hypothetical protein